MPTQIQLRRGTTSEHSSFTGAAGEVTVDTTKKTVVVHDGATAGGMALLPKTMTDGTANGVAYLNGSKVLTTGSDLVYNATGLGIGTTPGTTLDVYKATGNAIVRAWAASGVPRFDIRSATRYYSISIQSDNLTFFDESDGSTRMTLLANGNYGIGTSSPNRKLEVGGTSSALMGFNSTSNRRYTIGSDANGFSVYDDTAGAYRTVIDTSGNFLVGTTSAIASARMSVVGNVADMLVRLKNENTTAPSGLDVHYSGAATNNTSNWFYLARDSGANRFYVYSNGGIANYQANDANLSDRREKTNFAPAKSYLDTICAIPVQTFNYIDQSEDDPGLTLGVVAQDVQAVAPELVIESNWGTEDNPKMRLSVYQTDLQYALMKALQELKAEFDAYRATHP